MEDIKISGSGVINGGDYNAVKIFGSAKITGPIRAQEVKINGSSKFTDTLDVNLINVNGQTTFNKKVTAKEIRIFGSVSFDEEVESDYLKVMGHFNAKKDLNIGVLEANIGASHFTNIYGDVINIKCQYESNVDTIEATNIILKNIKANRISGEIIIIGKKCIIDVLEYSKSLTIAPGAKINKIIKL